MTVKENAYAKINLFLDVTGRREDGFHDILSVMHSVSLCDEITVSAETSCETEIALTTNVSDLSVGQENLVYRSAAKYLSYFGVCAKVKIHLEKNIPIGAGLGGGSTDGAATLRAMNRIFGLATEDQLLEMASELGSDVPFCLVGGTAVCSGRGERLAKSEISSSLNFVIAIGEERISTPKAYGALDGLYNNFAPGAYIPKDDITSPYNIFESVIHLEEITKIKEIMIKNGAEYTLMSGSGPSVFGTFVDFAQADVACDRLCAAGFTAFVATSKK